jgi:hypothetical protein
MYVHTYEAAKDSRRKLILVYEALRY